VPPFPSCSAPNSRGFVPPASSLRPLRLGCHVVPTSPASEPAVAPFSRELCDLVRRAQIGDLDAQSTLVRSYTRRIGGVVRRIVPHRTAWEDLVQVIFIRMIRRLSALRDPQVFESWLFSLARNTALDHLRRRRCQPDTVEADFELFTSPGTGGALAVDEILTALERALDRVPPRDRRLMRRIVQGDSYATAASLEGMSVGAAKIRVHRVRHFLRDSVSAAIGRPRAEKSKGRAPARFGLAA
jgi:RNA polymerase sigma-70 factor (ECF subfamily)